MKNRKSLVLSILSSGLLVCLVSGSALAFTDDSSRQRETSINSASAEEQTGVICDLSNRYFYENYYDQIYDLSYCDRDKSWTDNSNFSAL